MKEVDAPNCGQENELVGYLYGELSEAESRSFQNHLNSCVSCRTELAGFQDVRKSVITWRNESLAGASLSSAAVPASLVIAEKPSALAAIRQFLNLSPLWMKGAVAFASLLLCLLAGSAIMRLNERPAPVMVATPGNVQSEEKINALVQERVQQELKRLQDASQLAAKTDDVVNTPKPVKRVGAPAGRSIASNNPIQKARRPLSRSEREQLAADLRLVSARNESEFDLLDDGINQ